MQVIRKMAVFWLCMCCAQWGFTQNRAAYLATLAHNRSFPSFSNKNHSLSIPFEKSGNLLLVKAEIDQQEGFFILDTGAPTLVVNQPVAPRNIQAKGMSGQLMVSDTFIKIFRWNQIEWKNISSLTADMRKFNNVSQHGLMGLIGYEILRDYELVVDPAAQTIQLASNRKSLPYDPNQVLCSIPMQQQEHMPVIEVRIDGKPILLGVDTGSEINFLDQGLFENAILNGQEAGVSLIVGLGDQEKRARKVRLRNVEIGGIQLTGQQFMLSNLQQLFPQDASSRPIQGIVGSAFLNQFRYSINYRKGEFTLINQL